MISTSYIHLNECQMTVRDPCIHPPIINSFINIILFLFSCLLYNLAQYFRLTVLNGLIFCCSLNVLLLRLIIIKYVGSNLNHPTTHVCLLITFARMCVNIKSIWSLQHTLTILPPSQIKSGTSLGLLTYFIKWI